MLPQVPGSGVRFTVSWIQCYLRSGAGQALGQDASPGSEVGSQSLGENTTSDQELGSVFLRSKRRFLLFTRRLLEDQEIGSSSLSGYVLRSQKGFLHFTRRLPQDQEIGSGYLSRFFLRSQKGIPALHQEASHTVTRPYELFRHPDWMAPESTVRGRGNISPVRPG
jgi:hypothetical protein